ncbi:acyltransferase [Salipiger abyssi]|nr:acyltransferase [Salipiger abyssi]
MNFMRIYSGALRRISGKLADLRYGRYLEKHGSLRIGPGVAFKSFIGLAGREGKELRLIAHGGNWIGAGTVLQGSGAITLGANSFFGERCVIGCNERIDIGRDVLVAQHVTIRDTDHSFERTDIPINKQGISTAAVVIGDDVWLGHGAVILKGVTIGKGAIVAAGAVVNRDVGDYDIVGGVPARRIGSRLSQDEGPAAAPA